MKKLIALIMAVAMVMMCACALSSCGDKENADGGETQKLVMATNASFPPYEYVEDGKVTGIDAEIAEAIAKKLGMELEIQDIDFDSIVTGVQAGKFDMGMAGLTVTDERKENVNFTDSYAKGIQSVIVKADSEYESFEDFYTGFDEEGDPVATKEGITIGVQLTTTGDIYSSDTPKNWGFGEENVIRYKTGNEAVLALASGKVTAVIIDNEPAKSYVAANEGLKILDGAYTDEDYAICIAKENTELLEKVNTALNELKEDGTVQDIIDKYIPAE